MKRRAIIILASIGIGCSVAAALMAVSEKDTSELMGWLTTIVLNIVIIRREA